MQASRITAALVFIALVGAFPLMAAEPVAISTVAPVACQAEVSMPTLPAPPSGIVGLMPEPSLRYGRKDGPCTVSVTCMDEDETRLQCGGMQVCYWKLDGFPYRGFVECDGQRYTCP